MRFAPLVLAALCVATLFLGLDRVGFLDWREARDAEVAREMVRRKEGLTPLYAREAWFEKPVLAYAPEWLVRRIARPPAPGNPGYPADTAPSPLRSRQVRAAFAVCLILGTASLGARMFGMRAAWCAAGVLATTLALPLAARTDGAQLLGTLLGWVGCAGLADALFGRRGGRDARLIVTYGALGMAFATAGPLAALWPLGGLALYLALAREPEGWRRTRPLPGLAIVAGIGLPWYGVMLERHGPSFLLHAAFFPYATERPGAWYAGPALALAFLIVGFFPWSALLPGAMQHAATWWRVVRLPILGRRVFGAAHGDRPSPDPVARERREEGMSHYLIACLFAALVPVALYPGPPLPAALPAMPAAALLCGRYLDHLFEDPERLRRSFTSAVRMLALVGTAAAVMLTLVATRLRDAEPALRLLATVVFVTSWAPFLADFVGRRRVAAALMVLPVALGAPVTQLRVLPALDDYLSARVVAAAANLAVPPLSPILLVEPPPPSLRLYGDRNLVVTDSLAADLPRMRAADGMTYLAFRPGRESEVARTVGAPLDILLRAPTLILARVRAS